MIPLSVPNLNGNEWQYIRECLDTNWVSSVGSYVGRFERAVAEFCNVRHAIATSNGTAALHLSLQLAGVQRDDLVIAPNVTFVAPVNAIRYLGASPILLDIERQGWQIDIELLTTFLAEESVSKNNTCFHKRSGKRIAAILPVHVLGNMCDINRLLAIAAEYNLKVVEDATEALGSYYKGQHAGTFGDLGCLSFNGNKIITTGGGGMILTNNDALGRMARHLSTQAKADPEEYYHDDVGYNYRLVNVLAAMGVAQMEQLPVFLERKRQVTEFYNAVFACVKGAAPQKINENVSSNYWLYTVEVPNQQELRKYLRQHEVEARPFWVPMNRLPAFDKDIYYHDNDVSDAVYRNCLSLPCSTGITDGELQEVGNLVKTFYDR